MNISPPPIGTNTCGIHERDLKGLRHLFHDEGALHHL